MTQRYDPDLFAGTAAYYARFRAPYARAAIDHVIRTFGLGPGTRVLDLGCGPGTLTIPLAAVAGEVVAMDPDEGMLAEARRQAEAAGAGPNIRWIHGGSLDLAPVEGPFRLVTFGQSFHWMDRDQVLAELYDKVEDGGGLAMIAPGERRPQEVSEAIQAKVAYEFLGPQPPHPQRNKEPRHEPALRRSKFEITEYRDFPTTIDRDVASVIGHAYSTSGASKRLFGDRAPAFEAALTEALLAAEPSGVFHESIETAVLIAMKR